MEIRPERAGDAAAVRRVVSDAFARPDEADLVERLRANGHAALSLVAEHEGQIVGHALFSPLTAPFRALALAPVSVLPAQQGKGVGARLVRAGLEAAKAEGWAAVFVLGDPAYYGRFGFDAEAARPFASPYAGPSFLALALQAPLPAREGRVEHAPAFGSLGGAPTPRAVVEAWVRRFNAADVDGLASLYHPAAVNHQVTQAPVEGAAAIRAMFAREFAAAEMVCIVEAIHEAGEVAILEWRDPLGLRGCGFFTVREGKIVFQRGYWDKLSFLKLYGLPIE